MKQHFFQVPQSDRGALSRMQHALNYNTMARFLRDTIFEAILPNLDTIEVQPDLRKRIPLYGLSITFSDSESKLLIEAAQQAGFSNVGTFLRALAVAVAHRETVFG